MIRLEPGLLREFREFGTATADGSLELEFWNCGLLSGTHPLAATPDRARCIQEWLPRFEQLDADLRQRLLLSVRRWRLTRKAQPEIWFEELFSLQPQSRRLIPEEDWQDAFSQHAEFVRRLRENSAWGRDLPQLFVVGASPGHGEAQPLHRPRARPDGADLRPSDI